MQYLKESGYRTCKIATNLRKNNVILNLLRWPQYTCLLLV